MKKLIFIIGMLGVFGPICAGYAATYTCEEYYLDFIGDDSAYEKALEKCDGDASSCTVVDGTVSCGSGSSCTCPSGYSGTCTGSNYSTCYKTCSVTCSGEDTASCPTGNTCSYITTHKCSGKQYYGASYCNVGTCLCPVDVLLCGTYDCPSGYTDGDASYNTCKDETATAENTCYRTCSVACSGNATSSCPADSTCTYNTSYTNSGIQYYGGACNASATTCPMSSFSCNKGYYKNGTACARCSISGSTYGTTTGTGSTSDTSCYLPSGTTFSDTTGDGSYTGDCYYVN